MTNVNENSFSYSHKNEKYKESSCSIDNKDTSMLVSLSKDDFLHLVAAKIVLKVVSNSIQIVSQEAAAASTSNVQAQALNSSSLLSSSTISISMTSIENYVKSRKFFNTKRWFT